MSSNLPFRHISQAATQTVQYIDGRRKGEIKSLKVSHSKLNECTLDGFEWNKIITLAGLSGSGKSLIAEQWKRDLVTLNPEEDFDILSFEFEMLAKDQVARNLSGKLNKSTKQIFSANGYTVSDEEFTQIQNAAQELAKYPIYYVDISGTVEEIRNTIIKFSEKQKHAESDKGLVVTIDHILLTKGKQGEAEMQIIKQLYTMCIEMRKLYEHRGHKILFILLSQLNRDIEGKEERVLNPKLHYPQKTDIFGSSYAFFSSDYVIISHRPAKIPGILHYGLPYDGYPKGLPTICPDDPSKDMIYWHVLKNRGDEDRVLMMVEDFANSRVIDYIPENSSTTQ
jgi:replicative DNA helicase